METFDKMSLQDLCAIREHLMMRSDTTFKKYGIVTPELKKYILRGTSFEKYRNIGNINIIPIFLVSVYSIDYFEGTVKSYNGVISLSIAFSSNGLYYTGVEGIESFKYILPYKGSGVRWQDWAERVDKNKVRSLLGSISSISYNKFYNSIQDGIYAIYKLGYKWDGSLQLCLDDCCIPGKNIYNVSLKEQLSLARNGHLFTDSFVGSVVDRVIDIFGDNVKEVYFVSYVGYLGRVYARKNDDGEYTLVIM